MLPSWLGSWVVTSMEWLIEYVFYWVTGKTYVQRLCYNYQPPEQTTYLESRLRSSPSNCIQLVLSGDSKADIDRAVEEICRSEGIQETERSRLSDNLRRCVVQIHSLAATLSEAKRLKSITYSSDDVTHEEQLLELWSTLQPDQPLSDRISHQWGDIGFQGNDPATDFRGMGYFGLLNLLFFAKHRPDEAQRILLHSRHPTIGYGYAIAGINLTSLLLELLASNDLQQQLYKDVTDRPVTLTDFHETFCVLYEQFDKFWMAKEPENVMAFNAVRDDYKQALQESLRTTYTCRLPPSQFSSGR